MAAVEGAGCGPTGDLTPRSPDTIRYAWDGARSGTDRAIAGSTRRRFERQGEAGCRTQRSLQPVGDGASEPAR